MKRARIGVLAVLVCGALASPAAATQYTFSGQFCTGSQQGQRDDLVYNSLGVYNSDGTANASDGVYCPIGGIESTTVDVTAARVRVYDATANSNVYCSMQIRTQSGTLYTSATRYSCSTDTTNGCTTDVDSGTGYYGIAWTDPLNSGSSMSSVMAYDFSCQIPSTSQGGANGDSYIIGYETTQTAS